MKLDDELTALARMVSTMRFHQKNFFRDHKDRDLALSREWETRVDRRCREILDAQGKLFDATPEREVME